MIVEWKSVNDELPKTYRDEHGELIPFLACIKGGKYPFRALFDGKRWGDGMFAVEVTYWMDLPNPPED